MTGMDENEDVNASITGLRQIWIGAVPPTNRHTRMHLRHSTHAKHILGTQKTHTERAQHLKNNGAEGQQIHPKLGSNPRLKNAAKLSDH